MNIDLENDRGNQGDLEVDPQRVRELLAKARELDWTTDLELFNRLITEAAELEESVRRPERAEAYPLAEACMQ